MEMALEKKNGRTATNSTSKKAAVAALLYFPNRLEVWGETDTIISLLTEKSLFFG